MKKFLAALLVVVMVVSMIPATVFAATASDEECAVQKKYGTHSKAYCEAENVTYTQFGNTVAPECGQDGYTMYVCDCGEYFADDIIEMPDHEHAEGAKPVSARVEPTCNAYGKAAVYICKHCGKEYFEYESDAEKEAAEDDDDAPAGAIVKLAHTPVAGGSFAGNDCTKKQICAVCGEQYKNSNTKHKFNYSDPHAITKEPSTCAPGEATFKCTNPGCEQVSAPVAIIATGHGHPDYDNNSTLVEVDEEYPEKCSGTGTKAHFVCEECEAKFIEDEDDATKLIPATDADLVIEPEHLDPYVLHYRVPTCGLDGYITYRCGECNAKPWTDEYPALHDHTTLEEVKAHNELAKKDKNDDIEEWFLEPDDKGCPEGVTYTWYCQNPVWASEEIYEIYKEATSNDPALPALDALCYEVYVEGTLEWTDPATEGHTEYTVKVPYAYHPNYEANGELYAYSYNLVFCTNPECTVAKLSDWVYVAEGKDPFDTSKEQYLLNVSVVVGADGNIYEMNEDELAKYTFVRVERVRKVKLSKEPDNCKNYAHYYEYDSTGRNVTPTCAKTGIESYVCANGMCRDYTERVVPKLECVPDYTASKDCGTYDLKCKNCETVLYKKNKWTHEADEYVDTIPVPNCKQPAGDYYTCVHCDIDAFPAENVVEYKYSTRYDSLEEAELAHWTGNLTLLDSRPGNCVTVGKDEYRCSACSKVFWVYDVETTGHHIPDPSKVITEKDLEDLYNGVIPQDAVVYFEEANCLHGAGYTDYTCYRCGKGVKGQAALPHNLKEFKEVKATCTTDGNLLYYICLNECCGEEVVNAETGEKEWKYVIYEKVPVKYVDENGLNRTRDTYEPYADGAHILPKGTEHNLALKGSAPVSCVTAGYDYYRCDKCKEEVIKNFVPSTGHEMMSSEPVEKPADCVNDGMIYYVCANDWCTGDDGLACTCELNPVSLVDSNCTCKPGADDGIYTDEEIGVVILPALGHINASGLTVEDSCLSTEKDRVCIRANCPLKPATSGTNKGKKVVPKSHVEVSKEFAATCENPHYILITCANGCGKLNEVEHKGPALGHLFAWNERADLEFINAKDIEKIGEEFLKDAKAFNKQYAAVTAKAIIAYTPATYEADGSITFTCTDKTCNREITMAVKKVGIDFTIELDNAVVAGANNVYDVNGDLKGYNFIDGDVLAVTINMGAFETNVWGFNFDVNYDATALNFLGYKAFANDVFANFMVNNKVADDAEYDDVNKDGKDELITLIKNADGVVKVSAYTENAMDGTMFETKVSGTSKVVTLYFQIEALYTENNKGIDYVKAEEAFKLSVTASAADAKGDIETNGDDVDCTIGLMMDTNNNGNANITDVQNCVKIVKGQADVEYLAACDVNKDGAVNLTDLDLMNKALVGKADTFEIYKALSWNAPEGFVAA